MKKSPHVNPKRAWRGKAGITAALSRTKLADRLAQDLGVAAKRRQPSLPKLKFLQRPFLPEEGEI
jgi:hypothetical protein